MIVLALALLACWFAQILFIPVLEYGASTRVLTGR